MTVCNYKEERQTGCTNGMKTDEELLRLIGKGDEGAFAEMCERYQSSILRFAFHMTGLSAASEDVTQEVFLIIFEQPRAYDRSKGEFSAYLFGIARRQVFRWMKKNQALVSLSNQVEAEYHATLASTSSPLEDFIREQSIEAVRHAILTLPLRYREAVILCDLQEMSYAEASTALGCSIGTVRSRLHRARSLLLTKLSRPTNERRCL